MRYTYYFSLAVLAVIGALGLFVGPDAMAAGLLMASAPAVLDPEKVQAELSRIAVEVKQFADTERKRIDAHEARIQVAEQAVAYVKAGGSVAPGADGSRQLVRNALQPFFSSDQYKAFKGGLPDTGRVTLQGVSIRDLRASVNGPMTNYPGAEDEASEGSYAFPQAARSDRLFNAPQVALGLLDVLPPQTLDTDRYEFLQLTEEDGEPDFQDGEGAEKEEVAFKFALIEQRVKTVAGYTVVSEQALSDSTKMKTILEQRLTFLVLRRLERAIMNATGTGGSFVGLRPQATAFPAIGVRFVDAVGDAIATARTEGWQPAAVVMHPRAWQRVRAEREVDPDSEGDTPSGPYVAGSWAAPTPLSMWTLPVVLSASAPAPDSSNGLSALVLDLSQLLLLDRMAVSIQLGRINDQFIKNLISVRVELRAGLVVGAPDSVFEVTE